MKILVGCEESQTITLEMRKLGIEAYSCDIKDTSGPMPEFHFKMDVFQAIEIKKWDMAIFHPPCTYLSVSGLHWNKRIPGRAEKTEKALLFVKKLLAANIPKIALENPVSCISTRIRKPDQIIQPYDFGEDASKKTCLWLKGLPLLVPTKKIPPKIYCCGHELIFGKCQHCQGVKPPKKIWANQTPSGQNKLGPSKDRATLRSKTYQGIAEAIARQWTMKTQLRLF